jgi:putative NIF3 family GTP cyclohydrolase 1 type 2
VFAKKDEILDRIGLILPQKQEFEKGHIVQVRSEAHENDWGRQRRRRRRNSSHRGRGIDTFITGEAPHWAAVAAEELGMNLLLGGHYATETFGVKALAAHLSKRFKLPWEFLDLPIRL